MPTFPIPTKLGIVAAACLVMALHEAAGDDPARADVELQSGPLTPGLVLAESRKPFHQVRILAQAGRGESGRGTLVLDPNVPEFDEFGELVGGILTPQVDGKKSGTLPAVRLDCIIEFASEGRDGWRLYHIAGSEIRSKLRLATRGSLGDGGPARLLVLGPDEEVRSVVTLTTYGLVVP